MEVLPNGNRVLHGCPHPAHVLKSEEAVSIDPSPSAVWQRLMDREDTPARSYGKMHHQAYHQAEANVPERKGPKAGRESVEGGLADTSCETDM